MNDDFGHRPVFSFGVGTKAMFMKRDVVFDQKAMNGYWLIYQPHPEAEKIPSAMRGTRPDIEFNGRKFHTHDELTDAVLSGALVLPEEKISFVDQSQTFMAALVSRLDERRQSWAIIRYASVLALRAMREKFGPARGLQAKIELHEVEFHQLVKQHKRVLQGQVDEHRKRRHPFRKSGDEAEPVTPETAIKWERKLEDHGFGALIDRLNCSGNRTDRFHPEVLRIIDEQIDLHLQFEKLIVTHLHQAVRNQVKDLVANWPAIIAEREGRGEVIPDFVRKTPVAPRYEALCAIVNRIAPFRRLAGEKGSDWLLRHRISKGLGIEVTRAGQILMMDEYETDLFSLVSKLQIAEWIGYDELNRLGIGPGMTPVRCSLSSILDAYTECFPGFKISLRPSHDLAKSTIMMSMMDKRKLSTAAGCLSPWNHALRAECLLTDGGNFYVGAQAEMMGSACGIDRLIAPSGMANIRGAMERAFRTVHLGILARFPGRAFKDVVQRGEYLSEAEAVLTLDDLVRILTVWIVDFYHNTAHAGLGDNVTPNDVWHHEMTKGSGVRPVPSPAHMTKVFGTVTKRIVQATGLRIAHLDYDSEEFVRFRAKSAKREFRVCWWEENLDMVCVEVSPDRWLDLEVMNPKAKGLCVDEWMMVWRRVEIARIEGREEAIDNALAIIQATKEYAITMRRKLVRPTMDAEMLHRLEDKMVRFTKFPSKAIASHQTHGLTGVPIKGDAVAPAATPAAPGKLYPEPAPAAQLPTATAGPADTLPNAVARKPRKPTTPGSTAGQMD